MRRCLQLAARGRGRVGNGALVGAVLVRDGRVIAEAWHEGFGLDHAERALLKRFRGTLQPTDTLYVSLEPCCHHGKTPPCVDVLITRGVKRVVYGMADPDPRVSGKGIAALKKAGVDVIGPMLEQECRRLNRGFLSVRTVRRPWITLKMAQARSGRIAKHDGSPLKVTSEAQDRWAHEYLRARHDAILVGIGTILLDDPMLNRRFVQDPPPLVRIILDPHFKIPLEARVVNGELAEGTVVIQKETKESKESNETKEKKLLLTQRGVRVFDVPVRRGVFVWEELWRALMTPRDDYHGITSILAEGGPRTWRALKSAGLLDEEVVLVG